MSNLSLSARYVYTPAVGRFKGQSYILPWVQGDEQRTVDFATDALQTFPMAAGTYDASGMNPLWPKVGNWSATFIITATWCGLHGYAATFGGMERARYDFGQAILLGGMGLLKENLPSGSYYSYHTTTMKASGQVQTTRKAGGQAILLTVPLMCPTAYWTNPDGSRELYS